jgi:hypothetical protein
LVFLDLRFRTEENLIEPLIPLPPYGFRNPNEKITEENSNLFIIAFCRKTKPKVETSSLRDLKIMPRNLSKLYFHEFGLLTARRCISA